MTDKLFLENLYLKTHQLIVKSNSRNTNWIVNPWQVKSAEHMEKFKIKSISIKVARPSIFVGTPSIIYLNLLDYDKLIFIVKTL